jgi:NADPH2:quinone reductase
MSTHTSRAVRIDEHGGPEKLKLVTLTVGEPGPGEIRIRHKAVGLNYIDIYQRAGVYPLTMPLQLGMEGSGVVEAVGSAVRHVQPGDHVVLSGDSCGTCGHCHRGQPAYCDEFVPRNLSGWRVDGSSPMHLHCFELSPLVLQSG